MFVCAGTDPEDVIRNAFACFDEEMTGKINEDRLRELLTTMGDRFSDAEVCYLATASMQRWHKPELHVMMCKQSVVATSPLTYIATVYC